MGSAQIRTEKVTIHHEERARLKATPFSTDAGRQGWFVQLSERPLTTPCIGRGKVFIGGGYGSYEFFSLDMNTGNLKWAMRTDDDGPTAAVLFEEYVAFNTESCTLYVCEADTGRVVWSKWLGDPLLSQPAIARVNGSTLLFMVYPTRELGHALVAFELASGKRRWLQPVPMDAITAPIYADGTVVMAAMDGSIHSFSALDGAIINRDTQAKATSAPWIDRGELFYSVRDDTPEPQGKTGEHIGQEWPYEDIEARDWVDVEARRRAGLKRKAAYLANVADEAVLREMAYADAEVGFAAPPSSAKLHLAQKHLGWYAGRVVGAWRYEGARPVVVDGRLYTVLGSVFKAADRDTRERIWELSLEGEEKLYRPFSAPAYAGGKLYATSVDGDVVAIDARSGEVIWRVRVPDRLGTQPAVMHGKVYFGAQSGRVYCLDAQDPDAHGWSMWGGGPGHNELMAG